MSGFVPRQSPAPRSGLVVLIVLASLALLAGLTCVVLIVRPASGPSAAAPSVRDSPTWDRPSSPEPSETGGGSLPTDVPVPSDPTPGGTSSTPTPPAKRYAEVPDTGGPARGQAETFSRLLRSRGLACSDENLAKVFSRGCYLRIGGSGAARVEFIGPVNGDLGEVMIRVDTAFATAEEKAVAPAFEQLVGDFLTAAAVPSADAAEVRRRLAGEKAEYDVDWGEVKQSRSSADSEITFRRAGWDQPKGSGATLPADLALVESVATRLGYRCDREDYRIECVRTQGGEAELSAHGGKELSQLFVTVETGAEDGATATALADLGAVLDEVGGSRAAAAKQWFDLMRGTAGGLGYAGGMHAVFTLLDHQDTQWVQVGLNQPCRGPRGAFC